MPAIGCEATPGTRRPPAERPVAITGAASGMGRALAVAAARTGHPLLLLDRETGGLERTFREVAAGGGAPAMRVAVDARDADAVAAAVEEAGTTLGPAWGLAAAAGVLEGAFLEEIDYDHFRRVVDANVWGLLASARAAVPQMASRPDGGRIVFWSSGSAHGGSPGYGVYAATKAAAVSLAKTLALELADRGIRVNALLPGAIDTPMVAHVPDDIRRSIAAGTPLGRWGHADEVAAAALFLLSDAAAYVTGAVIDVDGGIGSAASGSIDIGQVRRRIAAERMDRERRSGLRGAL